MIATRILITCLVIFFLLFFAFRENFEIRSFLKALRVFENYSSLTACLRNETGFIKNLIYCDRFNAKENESVACGKPFSSAWVTYLHVFNISDEQVRGD